MSGKGAVASGKKSSKSSGIHIDGLLRTVGDESGIVLDNDIKMLRESDRRYIRVGSCIILLTIIAASSVVAFSVYNLYFQFRLQEMGLASVPYIAAIVIVLAISSAATCAVVYNSPHFGRIRKASEENRKWLINCTEDLVRVMVATIEKNADIISKGKESIRDICAEEEVVIREIEELRSAHELYSRVHELKKVRRGALERVSNEAHEVVSAMREDFSSALDYYGKLSNSRNIIRGNLREAMELVIRSVAKLHENRAILAAKREEYRVALVDLEVANAKVNSFLDERGIADSDQLASYEIEERAGYDEALKTYDDKKKLSDTLSKEVDAMQLRVSELKRDIDFLNDDIQSMKTELEGISEKMDGIDKSLTVRETNVGSAIEFRDSVSQDLILELMKLADTFSSPWNARVNQLCSIDKFFGITERKKKITQEIKDAREKSFRAYTELSSIFSETSNNIINGSEYLRAVKRRDFRGQLRDEWCGLDLSVLRKKSEVEEVPTTSHSESAQEDILVIEEVGENTVPAKDSESKDVMREAEASTSSAAAAAASTSSASSALGKKHLITVESTDITREKVTSYRSFFSLRKKLPTAEGSIADRDVKTGAIPSYRNFFSLKKKFPATDNSIGDQEDIKVEGAFASLRKYIAGVAGGAASSANSKERAHTLVEVKAESVSLQQASGKKA